MTIERKCYDNGIVVVHKNLPYPLATHQKSKMSTVAFSERLALVWAPKGSRETMTKQSIVMRSSIIFRHIWNSEENCLSKMPDYLGKDQRKTKDDDSKDDKPIQGTCSALQ